MKKRSVVLVILLVVVIGIGSALLMSSRNKVTKALTPVRIGWPISWMPGGQITAVLNHTDILKQNGLVPEFKKFTYGAPLAEAALAGELDIAFVGQVPALSLISKSDKWIIVSRLADGRAAIIVPKDSNINNVADLKGKVLALPFGTLNQLQALSAFKEQGIDSKKDVTIKNVDAVELSNVIKKGSSQSWGDIDASSLWDPTVAQLEDAGLAKTIQEFRLDGVVVMSKDFYTKNPEAAKEFLKSMVETHFYYKDNKNTANAWYFQDSGLKFSQSVTDKSVSLERNFNAKTINDISLSLEQSDLSRITEEANAGFEVGILKKQLQINDVVDQSLVNSAQQEIRSGDYLKSVGINK